MPAEEISLNLFPMPTGPHLVEPSVRVKVSDLFPLLDVARRNGYAWLDDFADDDVMISSDLADIARRFREILTRKKSA